ncbi:pentapeptide repeat-containing protein [Caulobacter sp. 17J65-9]|uniref:pentapeptide repeat-containing protein n=1 Tax=Caulobacter sp. 17J65-9 TaxID=2709382 RepID=UPI0013CA0613|nr:pentapeptide repeat-containing protein [Caulobacter sp. 17J65-9]NEX93548.1 hypothetical protein [Caulobacter sp. 17J65-9]
MNTCKAHLRRLLGATAAATALLAAGQAWAQDDLGCESDTVQAFRVERGAAKTGEVSPWLEPDIVVDSDLTDPKDLKQWSGKTVVVHGAQLKGADMSRLKLDRICFVDSDLSGTVWTGTKTSNLVFIRSDLTGANLAGAALRSAVLLDSRLDGAKASKADLTRTAMAGGGFENLDLSGANLTDASLYCGMIVGDWNCETDGGIDLRGAQLTRTHMAASFGKVAGARLNGANVELTDLPQLREAVPAGPVTVRASAYGQATVSLTPQEWRTLLAAWGEPAPEPTGPSFDCAKASTPVERRICDGSAWGVAELDRNLAELYRMTLAAGHTTTADQQRWLGTRSACLDPKRFQDADDCLRTWYAARIAVLQKSLGAPAWLTPGTEALYISDDLPVSDDFRQTALYRKVLPVIVSSSWQTLYVRAEAGGRMYAYGEAWGGNGHSCSLFGRESDGTLAMGDKSGWYGGPRPDYSDKPGTWADVFRLWGEHAEILEDPDAGYASCGARASFGGRLTRVPAGDVEFDGLTNMEGDPVRAK